MLIQIPSISEIVLFGSFFFIVTLGIGLLAGLLKKYFNIKTNYTRKVFHIGVFSAAAGVGLLWGFKMTILFGLAAGAYLFMLILLGEGDVLYEGVARESDAPHRTLHLIIPYFATAIGGMLSNYFFGTFAVVGYLVAGWGDAAGEPAGVRFGKHKYRVLTLNRTECYRTIEGSLAIFIISFLMVLIFLTKIMSIRYSYVLLIALSAASLSTIVEAISPHGTDNFTVQLAAAAACYLLLM